jgi:hypothetical protein
MEKVFRWQPAPGVSAQGFLKMLGQWQEELLAVLLPHLRTQLREVQPEQWETAGYVAFAADGSRVAVARTKALEAHFAPQRRPRRRRGRKPSARARRVPKRQAAAARHKKGDGVRFLETKRE